MKTPTTEQREALGRLQFSRDGKVLVDYLREADGEAKNAIVAVEDPHRVRLMQGESRVLRELLKLLVPVSS